MEDLPPGDIISDRRKEIILEKLRSRIDDKNASDYISYVLSNKSGGETVGKIIGPFLILDKRDREKCVIVILKRKIMVKNPYAHLNLDCGQTSYGGMTCPYKIPGRIVVLPFEQFPDFYHRHVQHKKIDPGVYQELIYYMDIKIDYSKYTDNIYARYLVDSTIPKPTKNYEDGNNLYIPYRTYILSVSIINRSADDEKLKTATDLLSNFIGDDVGVYMDILTIIVGLCKYKSELRKVLKGESERLHSLPDDTYSIRKNLLSIYRKVKSRVSL